MRLPSLFRRTPFRLTLLFLALFVATASAVMSYVYMASAAEARSRAEASVRAEVETLIGIYRTRGRTALNQTLIDHEIGPDGDYRAGWYLEDWHGERLLWHSGWNEKKGSAIYLKVPSHKLTLIALANTESLWWGNSLVRAEIHRSPIAARFLEEFAR